MSVRTSHRISAGVAPLAIAGLMLSACGGGDGDAASRPTITLEAGATSFQTLPPATAAPTESEATSEEDDEDASGVQEYTVQSGDYGFKVANDFGVSLEDLENINGWSDAGVDFPNPPTVIKIPAGGTAPGSSSNDSGDSGDSGGSSGDEGTATPDEGDDSEDTDSGATDSGNTDSGATDSGDDGETGEAIPEPGGDGCEAGSYTIEDGDFEGRVADKFDVTVDALREANAQTADYSVFFVGLEIVIPARDDC